MVHGIHGIKKDRDYFPVLLSKEDAMTWAEKVKQKDGMRCVLCGETHQLQAHHIKPTYLYPEYRNDVNNGVTLCSSCHQAQHGGHFAGYTIKPINGIDPDPEGRMETYKAERLKKQEEKRMVHVVWATNKATGDIVFEAAKAAKQLPSNYIGEAIYMRLQADGFECDRNLFVREWLEPARNTETK